MLIKVSENKKRSKRIQNLVDERQINLPDLGDKAYSLFIRHLDCGSCNACERELGALSNPIFDIARWGIHFKASPRHADVLALTGPYVRGLDKAARSTLEAMPVPRIITIGDCAGKEIGLCDAYGVLSFPSEIEEAFIAHVPGCPPSPEDLLESLISVAKEFSGR